MEFHGFPELRLDCELKSDWLIPSKTFLAIFMPSQRLLGDWLESRRCSKRRYNSMGLLCAVARGARGDSRAERARPGNSSPFEKVHFHVLIGVLAATEC